MPATKKPFRSNILETNERRRPLSEQNIQVVSLTARDHACRRRLRQLDLREKFTESEWYIELYDESKKFH